MVAERDLCSTERPILSVGAPTSVHCAGFVASRDNKTIENYKQSLLFRKKRLSYLCGGFHEKEVAQPEYEPQKFTTMNKRKLKWKYAYEPYNLVVLRGGEKTEVQHAVLYT